MIIVILTVLHLDRIVYQQKVLSVNECVSLSQYIIKKIKHKKDDIKIVCEIKKEV